MTDAEKNWPAGGSEMGELIRAKDWSKTPLGPAKTWPQPLRSALEICLDSLSPIGIYWGKDLILLYNDAMIPLMGDNHSSGLGQPLREVIPEAWETMEPKVEQVLSTGDAAASKEFFLPLHRNGYREECYFDFTLNPIRDEEGAVAGIFNICTESTGRVQNKQELRKGKKYYQTLFESIDEGFCIIEMIFDENDAPVDYRFLEVNPSFEEQTGIKDAKGKRMRQIAPGHEEHWFKIYGDVALTGESIRFEEPAQSLNRWFDVFAYPFGPPEKRQVALLFKDITEQKEMEKRLQKSEGQLRLAVQIVRLGIWRYNNHTNLVHLDKRMRELWGEDEGSSTVSLSRFLERIHPDDKADVENAINSALESETNSAYSLEYRIVWDDGSIHWIAGNGEAQFEGEGENRKATGVFGTALDITDRKKTEEAQKRNEEKLITLKDKLNSDLSAMTHLHELSMRLTATFELQPLIEEVLNAAIEIQDADFGSIQLYNPKTGLLELFAQQGFGQKFKQVYEKEKGTKETGDMAFQEGQRIIIEDIETDARYKNQENSPGYRAIQFTPLFNRSGNTIGILSTYFRKPHRPSERELRFTDLYARQAADIISFKLSEEQLRESEEQLQSMNEKLEERVEERTASLLSYQDQLRSLASKLSKAEEQERQRLAAELHDNLGQMLAVCKIKLDLFQKEGLSDEALTDMNELKELVDEALRYTRELMSDLKPPPSLDKEDIGVAMEWLAKKMEKHGLKVTLEDDGQPKPVTEEVQTTLLQCVRELLFNVIKHAQTDKARVALSQRKGKIQVTVEDKGVGFDSNGAKTVSSEEGGFGLFNIRERIDLLGGSLNIISESGKGTKVLFNAPLKGISKKDDKTKKKKKAPPVKVLLVDDHEMMRRGLRNIIEEEDGLMVIAEAADGEEAVKLAGKASPDIIVMDVNMPKMDGIDATRKIISEMPHIRIIGLSLHDEADVAEEMRNVGASAYLTKADAFETLCATIRSEAARVKK